MAAKPPPRTIARSSVTGRIVTQKYAQTHPTTTQIETVKPAVADG